MSCLLRCPHKWKYALSLKNGHVQETGVDLVPLADSCWPEFEPKESALCMERVSGRYD